MDCSPPGSSICGILQARILEWVAISSSKGSSWLTDKTHASCVFCIAGRFFIPESKVSNTLDQFSKPGSLCTRRCKKYSKIQTWIVPRESFPDLQLHSQLCLKCICLRKYFFLFHTFLSKPYLCITEFYSVEVPHNESLSMPMSLIWTWMTG